MASSPAVRAPDFATAEDGPDADEAVRGLKQPCPVTPLGVQGSKLHFLDRLNQLQSVTTECRKNDMTLWFGDGYLEGAYPQWKQGSKKDDAPTKDGFNQKTSSAALVEECVRKGIFNPQGRVFGRGAHRARGDEEILVLHMGRQVLIANAPDAKARREGHVQTSAAGALRIAGVDAFFPAAEALPAPDKVPATREETGDVLATLRKWNWADPAAPLLLLGMIGQMYFCGVLDWRAHVWMPGPTASGKSSLQKIIRALMNEWCLSTADATEAAIRQILGNDTLAVSIDEAEPHDNPERLAAVMNLIKKASSGDKILRGGADHKGQEFTAQSCFLLSSVMHAPLRGEDRNRIALLELRALPEDVEPLEMELAKWRSTGRRLHRRMIEQWGRWHSTLAAYEMEIGKHRFAGRWQQTYGTLLACADLLLYDLPPRIAGESDEEPGMSRVSAAVTSILPMLGKSRGEARTDDESCLRYLTSIALPGAKGSAPEPVGVWVDRAVNGTMIDGSKHGLASDYLEIDEAARDKLKAHGMRVVQAARDEKTGNWKLIGEALMGDEGWTGCYLAVAYATNEGIKRLFDGSDWAKGGWVQSLKKLAGTGQMKMRFAGPLDNCLLVPLKHFRGEDE